MIRTVRTVRIACVPGFLARGLGGGEPPRLEPMPALDLGFLGLWIHARATHGDHEAPG